MKMLGGFVLRFALVFGLLILPWPGLQTAVQAGFRVQTRLVTGLILPRQAFRVEKYSDPAHPALDTLVVVMDQEKTGSPGKSGTLGVPLDSISQGWIPLAMLIALLGATPVPWSKRWKALLAGVVVIEFLVVVTILVAVAFGLTNDNRAVGPNLALVFAHRLFVENIWFSFMPSFLLWAYWLVWSGHWKPLGRRLTSVTPVN